ncbi:hypothetical protein AVEN_194908-1 [Araneus ventricosus]|uniref:Uncharacterized protein n=1 Tax=Araneus ventricosus TaxID=182803 RepID=A0A4Y2B4E1_ARAVE|nr:hypothetical protein AVEN_194908-1 [Araneus ventricosus]
MEKERNRSIQKRSEIRSEYFAPRKDCKTLRKDDALSSAERSENSLHRSEFRSFCLSVQVLRNENIIDDPQVLQEEERIRNLTAIQQGSSGEALVVLGLTKMYGNFSAVNRLTFGFNREEYFVEFLELKGLGKRAHSEC